MTDRPRLIVGDFGLALPTETHLGKTRTAEVTLVHETDLRGERRPAARGCGISGWRSRGHGVEWKFQTTGMIVAPSSKRSLSEIAQGITSNLLTRAADVVLEERRKPDLVARETSSHAIHLRNMATLSGTGAIVARSCRLSTIVPRSWTISLITRFARCSTS